MGRVTLRVQSREDALHFYTEGLGLVPHETDGEIRLTAGDADAPLVALRVDPDAAPRGQADAGLYHLALRVPDRPALGAALRRLREAGYQLTGASDHLVSEALYFRDPEGNGVEVYTDRPREEWTRTDDGGIEIATLPLDVEELLADAAGGDGALPADTDVGHVHLEATDLDDSILFYRDTVGFPVQFEVPQAAFLGAGGYHHHLGINTWQERSRIHRDETAGLAAYEIVTSPAAVDRLPDRLREHGVPVTPLDDGFETRDPDGITIRVRADESLSG